MRKSIRQEQRVSRCSQAHLHVCDAVCDAGKNEERKDSTAKEDGCPGVSRNELRPLTPNTSLCYPHL